MAATDYGEIFMELPDYPGCPAFSLDEAVARLAARPPVHTLLAVHFGQERATSALRRMSSGEFDPEDGEIWDLLSDEIENSAVKVAYAGFTGPDEDESPVWISEYHGIFFVRGLEHGPFGFFGSLEDAQSCDWYCFPDDLTTWELGQRREDE